MVKMYSNCLVLFLCHFLYLTGHTVVPLGFDEIEGSYCSRRPQNSQCCQTRDDDCTVPILGNHLCYCDFFCGQHPGHDCCPDFKEVCLGQRPPQPTTLAREDVGQQKECLDNAGRGHNHGETYKFNCNDCVCGRGCDENACVINAELLHKVNYDGRYSWRAENYTKFWGMLLSDGIKYRLGTLYPERSVQNMNEIAPDSKESIPDHFDSREKWPRFIHPVRDQKNCGSSWAFSTTAVSADRLAIQSGGKLNVALSAQQLISCNQQKQKGCTGGYLDRAWWYIHKLGVVDDQCYPYTSGDSSEMGQCTTPKAIYRAGGLNLICPSGSGNNRIYKVTPTYRISSKEEDIQHEILQNGPVQATFLVHEDFYMYNSGVYEHLDLARELGSNYRKSAYHSVRIIGWGIDTSTGRSVKFWLCDNSWGTDWGEDGFFRIIRGENHCEIESFVLAAWGKSDDKKKLLFTARKVRKMLKF